MRLGSPWLAPPPREPFRKTRGGGATPLVMREGIVTSHATAVKRNKPDVLGMLLVVCALVITALLVRRELAPAQRTTRRGDGPPERVKEWSTILQNRLPAGVQTPVTILEFGDFECPACQYFETILDSIRARYPGSVTVLYAHFPIPRHQFALPAVRASECAREQGRFDQMRNVLYSRQDSFGVMPWTAIAARAGVADTIEFASCVRESGPIAQLAIDTVLANQLGATATPTIVVNGWRWRMVPTLAKLDSAVREALPGKTASMSPSSR